ncbi:glycosyltransferase family 2 protein [Carnobacterium pleistocenium]|uniref:glycosyltransferase family 2 protein n=1 Tax=Carnobacterium pleistocenium TaxID=181073 RepID=UPI000556DF15|nr:glycosyltransferase family 2 protein [Carnobacterium pleistocenium]
MEEIKISVIVTTYRREASLKTALNSLGKQTYTNIEIIIVDDNADIFWNNKVKDILLNYKKNQDITLVYIINEKNEGSAQSRNLGIDRATGKYITFLDDDDIYGPDKIKNQLTDMIKNQADYSLTDLWLYSDEGKLIEKRSRDYILDKSPKSLQRYHLKYHMTGTDVMMFKKSYLKFIGGFAKVDVGDEFYLMHKAIRGKGKFTYLKKCDVKAYVHTKINGLSSGNGKIYGENRLYEYKEKYFNILSSKDISYIKMRHFAVLSFAELRRKRMLMFLKYAVISFFHEPTQSITLLLKRRIK